MIPSEDNFSPLLCIGNAHVNVPTGKLSPQLSTESELKKVLFGAPFGAPLELKALSSACCLARVPATGYCISLQHFGFNYCCVLCILALGEGSASAQLYQSKTIRGFCSKDARRMYVHLYIIGTDERRSL